MRKNKRAPHIVSKDQTFCILYCTYKDWINFGRHIANNIYRKSELTGDSDVVEVTTIASFEQSQFLGGIEVGEKCNGYVVTTLENIPGLLKNIADFYIVNPLTREIFSEIDPDCYFPTFKRDLPVIGPSPGIA